MGTTTAPANQPARSTTVHSKRVLDITATVSPAPMPEAMKPLASAATCPSSSAAETSDHEPLRLTAYSARCGSRWCCATRRSVMFDPAGMAARSSVTASRTSCSLSASGKSCGVLPGSDPARHPHPPAPLVVIDQLCGPDRQEERRDQEGRRHKQPDHQYALAA